MNAHTQKITLTGPCGEIEALRDDPTTPHPSRGVAVLAHPHPLYGGTMHNKVVQTLARAFVQAGYSAVRFNFRGVGTSAGSYDEGRGEVQDFLSVVAQQAGTGVLAVGGFSFGAYIVTQALQHLWSSGRIEHIVLVGTATSRFEAPPIPAEAHSRTLVLHGEQDDTVPLSAVLQWARPQSLPVTVIPGVEHFFHGQLPVLKNCVLRHIQPMRT